MLLLGTHTYSRTWAAPLARGTQLPQITEESVCIRAAEQQVAAGRINDQRRARASAGTCGYLERVQLQSAPVECPGVVEKAAVNTAAAEHQIAVLRVGCGESVKLARRRSLLGLFLPRSSVGIECPDVA